ncbi:MAG TPA: hypothetical protein VGF55_04825 [Gemmataceae bacterium]
MLFGVSGARRQLLERHSFPVPDPVPVRAVIDTGSAVTAISPRVFTALDIRPFGERAILTPSTRFDAPHPAVQYLVSLFLVSADQPHRIPDVHVIAADCWVPGGGVEALIGCDVLNRCGFEYAGPHRTFMLAF